MASQDLNVEPPELRRYGTIHRQTGVDLRAWATAEAGFPSEYLETHGLANYVTFVGVAHHFSTRSVGGSTFAARQDSSDVALHSSATVFTTRDAEAGSVVQQD